MAEKIKYNLDLLEQFRDSAVKAGGRTGTIGDDITGQRVPYDAFGRTAGSSALANAVAQLVAATERQTAKGEELMRAVGRSIDNVIEAIEQAERTNQQTFLAGRQTLDNGGGGGGGGGGPVDTTPSGPHHSTTYAPPVDPGTGVTVNLPKGLGTVEAPNAKAAGAVRAALTQLGVPYVWGAENPGHGFDCSGLTKWAYGKEGVDLEHFAAHQDIGKPVSRADLAPGDLVVWDGHVAMYIGAGKVIEAPQTGDVVHIVPLYTHNGNDRFEGFYRPTA